MNIGRNDPCSCGSGLKSKKCCAGKKTAVEAPSPMSVSAVLDVIKSGFGILSLLSEQLKNVRVRDLCLVNGGDTICCEFISDYTSSLDIKGEMAVIMGYFSGSFKDDPYENMKINYFASKAFDEDGHELMYVVSSKTAAASIAAGNSVEWLKASWFQENTSDYRLSRAKTFISDIENALRSVIVDIYKKKLGINWWDIALAGKIGDSVKATYERQFDTTTTDGEVLIMYTFTLDLKKIVCADWGVFKHLFGKMDVFENAIAELNVIRREEAHNREITDRHLVDLERIYETLLTEIAPRYPKIILNYMVENWRSKIKKAMFYTFKPVYTAEQFDAAVSLSEKRDLILKDSNAQVDYLEGLLLQLNSFTPPLSKKGKHDDLIVLLQQYKDLQVEKRDCTTRYEFDNVQDLLARIIDQQGKMDIFSKQFLLEES